MFRDRNIKYLHISNLEYDSLSKITPKSIEELHIFYSDYNFNLLELRELSQLSLLTNLKKLVLHHPYAIIRDIPRSLQQIIISTRHCTNGLDRYLNIDLSNLQPNKMGLLPDIVIPGMIPHLIRKNENIENIQQVFEFDPHLCRMSTQYACLYGRYDVFDWLKSRNVAWDPNEHSIIDLKKIVSHYNIPNEGVESKLCDTYWKRLCADWYSDKSTTI